MCVSRYYIVSDPFLYNNPTISIIQDTHSYFIIMNILKDRSYSKKRINIQIFNIMDMRFGRHLAGRNYLFPRPIPKNTNANQMIILSLISPFVNPSSFPPSKPAANLNFLRHNQKSNEHPQIPYTDPSSSNSIANF